MMALTCCQDHILTENIWFVCSETSYSEDRGDVTDAGQPTEQLKIELLSQLKLEAESTKKTQMLQTVDLPKTISDHHNHRSNHLDSRSVSEKKSFLFRASGISQEGMFQYQSKFHDLR